MNRTPITIASLIAAAMLAPVAHADIVQIDIVGSVDFGAVRSGDWQDAHSGDPVTMSFQVDSDVFTNGSFPTRGYNIIESSFALTVNGITAGMPNPYPSGTPYFVVRDNDPAVDGFLLATDPDAVPSGLFINQPGLIDEHLGALFSATYGGDTLSSLDILDAQGTYDFTGLMVFNWGLSDAGQQPMGFIFDSFSITAVPAPASALGLAPLSLMALRRRRRA